MRRTIFIPLLLLACSAGCATTRSSVEIETRVHKPVAAETPDYDLTARVCIDTPAVR
jgi:hypothetical protein